MLYIIPLALACIIVSTQHFTEAKPINVHNNKAIRLPLIKKTSSRLSKRSSSAKYALQDQSLVEYVTKVNIGTPPQEFLVTVDTGSADLWVPSTACSQSECPYSKFSTEKSSTYRSLNQTFTIQYGAGYIEGSYAAETISLTNAQQQITSQPVGLVSSAKDGIISSDTDANGILGLAFPALTANSDTAQAYDPYVFNLAKQNMLTDPVFSISLSKEQMMVGGIDKDLYTGDVHYIPVVKNTNPKTQQQDYTFWSVELQDVKVNGNSSNVVSESKKQSVILDTGTTLSYVNKELADEIVKAVTNKTSVSLDLATEMYTVDCNLKNSDAKVELVFAGASQDQPVRLEVAVQDLVYSHGGDNQCSFGISYHFDKSNTFVLGGTVLRSAYFVFNINDKTVGLATVKDSKSRVLV